MGLDINVHDQWAVESMGRIQDRTQEHLGKTDVGIIKYRRMLRTAIAAMEAGDTASLKMQNGGTEAIRGPLSNDAIAPDDNWVAASEAADHERRGQCNWDASV
jgi:hypothetical protein